MPLYGGSIGQGYSDALSAISRQNVEKAQLAEMLFNLQRAKQQQAANQGIGAVLYQMYGAGQQSGTPVPPPPGQQSMPPAPPAGAAPLAPPAGSGPPAGGAAPPPPSMGGTPLPGPGGAYPGAALNVTGTMGQAGPSDPNLQSAQWQGNPYGAAQAGMQGPSVPPPGTAAPTVPPYTAPPGAPPAGGATATPPGPPQPGGAGPVTVPGTPSPYAGAQSIMQVPEIQKFIQTAKQIGVPPEQIADMLTQANPMFGLEYRAAIAGQNAYIHAMQAGTQQERADAYTNRVAAQNIQSEADTMRKDREESRKEKQTTALIKKWDDAETRLKAAGGNTPANQRLIQERNDDIEASRKYVLANLPGSKGQKNDFTYQAKVVKAMTKKLYVDDADYEKWSDFPADVEPTDSGPLMEWFKSFFQRGEAPPAAPGGRESGGPVTKPGGGWSIQPIK